MKKLVAKQHDILEYEADLLRMVSVCHIRGYDISGQDVHKIWREYSIRKAVAWLDLPQGDDELFNIIYEASQEVN